MADITTKSVLSTRVVINWLKLIVIFPCILFTAILITAFDYYGMEFAILAMCLLSVLWFYRITYSGSDEAEGLSVKVKVQVNVFGVKFITIKVNGTKQVNNIILKSNNFYFLNDKYRLSVKLIPLKKGGFSSNCKVNVL
ncbi:hypothetical protein [Shewanella youngdeokensis]|uniref:Uncharacterized protein n=1 Tax=Shewanella youngdeokensis TaxID=2999068 RepID=A0ABZ0JVY1_9GAMM|nr:hypothetical protein RGE70_09570 [Shewanella sp. DAU334]